jgi:heat shock protein HslJ
MTRRLRQLLVMVVIPILVLSLAACADPVEPSPSGVDGHPTTLAGTAWRVVSVGGRQPVVTREPTVAFEASRVSGSGGCNSFGGSYRYEAGGAIRLEDLGMTAMACVERPINDLEGAFMQALTSATLVSVDPSGLLVLSGSGGQIFLAPIAAPAGAQPTP